jgi:antitoxin component of MazEF toxin-antitoxin module
MSNKYRSLRKLGGSFALTIPKHIVEFYNFKEGDQFNFYPLGNKEIKIKKIEGKYE